MTCDDPDTSGGAVRRVFDRDGRLVLVSTGFVLASADEEPPAPERSEQDGVVTYSYGAIGPDGKRSR
jgi:hypothetical protein